jgi:hypothetical protein
MTDTLTIRGWLDRFTDHLKTIEGDEKRVTRLTNLGGGFESWLKFEMATLLMAPPFEYSPWGGPGLDTEGDVGIEYRARLEDGSQKLVDLWASPAHNAKRWLFVELKVAFDNYNAQKQFASWRADFEALRRIDGREPLQRVAGIASVIFGAGFTRRRFQELMEDAAPRRIKPWVEVVTLDAKDLRIAALVAPR